MFFNVITIVLSCLRRRINVKLTNSTFEWNRVVIRFAQQESSIHIQCLFFFKARVSVHTVLSTGRVQEHLVPLETQGQTVPLPVVDIIVKPYRAPLPSVHQNFPRCELHAELHFLFLRENWEQKSAVDAMNGQAENQGQVGAGVACRDNSVQRHLDTSPRSEDDSHLGWDDAMWDGSNADRRWTARDLAREPELLKNIHIFTNREEWKVSGFLNLENPWPKYEPTNKYDYQESAAFRMSMSPTKQVIIHYSDDSKRYL